jgi:lipopolysaccharide cholinephosphotransferase
MEEYKVDGRTELSINEIHEVEFDILKKIDQIVRKLGISYGMAYGSLIGTIRHHGFIPWDDDLDITMLRSDYEIFVKYFSEHEDELYPYRLFTPEKNPDYPHIIARVCHINYPVVVDNEIPCGMGVFVDIYPLDGMGNDEKQLIRENKYVQRWIDEQFWATRIHFEAPKKIYRIPDKFIKYVYAKCRGKKYFEKKLLAYAKKYKFEDSRYIGIGNWGSFLVYFEKEWFLNTLTMDFEGYPVMVPGGYDNILKAIYGDYMQLPPEDKRKPQHNYRAYKKNITQNRE